MAEFISPERRRGAREPRVSESGDDGGRVDAERRGLAAGELDGGARLAGHEDWWASSSEPCSVVESAAAKTATTS
jgi:hypothetical protein